MVIRFFLFAALQSLACNAQTLSVVSDWKNDKSLKGASCGFSVYDLNANAPIAELNSKELLIPASTLKVITTSAALKLLGTSYKYQTTLAHTGQFNKETGILDGDLIIIGSGDPSLQSEYFGKELITDVWAKQLKERGIKHIKGKIIGDASSFERNIPGEWIWADIGNYFGATPCGLSFMDNKFKLYYTSGGSGSEAKLTGTSPAYTHKIYDIDSKVMAQGSEDEAYVYGHPFSFTREVRGTIPPNKTNYEVEASLPDPALLCAQMLVTSLQKIGIKCNVESAQSNYEKKALSTDRKVIYTHYSPTLDKLIFHTNLKSNNQYCQSLLLTLGKGNAKDGIEIIKNFCVERGLSIDELHMTDGSGLSRANLCTTSLLTSLLSKMSKDSVHYKILKNSFAVAGKTGSMSNIGKNTFIENNMQAKTGYINRARAYCGYVKSRSGKDLAFSVILNNYTCSAKEAKLKLEKFLVELGEL